MPFPSDTLFPSDSLFPGDTDEVVVEEPTVDATYYWPVDPSATFISSTTDRGVALEFAAPWPAAVTDEEDISIIDEVLYDLLTRTPTVGLGFSLELPFVLGATSVTGGLSYSSYALDSTVVLG
jgi:hypothetical protein